MKFLLPILSAILLAGCSPEVSKDAVGRSVTVASALPAGSTNPEARWVSDLGEALSQGGMQPLLYPGGILGKEIERSEQTSLGLIAVNVSSGDDVMQYSPILRALRLPFFIASRDQLECILQHNEFRAEMSAQTRRHGVEVVDIILMGSPAGLFLTGEAPRGTRDLANRRIRAMDRMQVEVIGGWGASPVQVPWEEVQTALQTGIVQGYINPPGIVRQFGHEAMFESFFALDVFMGFRFVVVSSEWLEGLSPDERETFERALEQARRANRAGTRVEEQETLAGLRAKGVSIVRPTERNMESFREDAIRAAYSAVPRKVLERATNIRDTRCSD